MLSIAVNNLCFLAIETIFDKGFVIKAKGLLLKGYDFNDDETKFGVSVSKKSFPTAVKRNLIKRRVRHLSLIHI